MKPIQPKYGQPHGPWVILWDSGQKSVGFSSAERARHKAESYLRISALHADQTYKIVNTDDR